MSPASSTGASGALLCNARRAAGLSQDALAAKSGTSRTTISAYERGRKSPSLDTAVRLLTAAGFELRTSRRPVGRSVVGSRGRRFTVLTALPGLPVERALATVELPLAVNWSAPGRRFNLADRNDRARLYEIVLQEGQAHDLLTYIDGALLVDLRDDMVLPRDVRTAWAPLIEPLLKAGNTGVAITT